MSHWFAVVARIHRLAVIAMSGRFAGIGLVVTFVVGLAGAVLAASPAPPTAVVAPGIRGALVLEPGRIRAGDVATLEIVVTTPPGHRLRAVSPPAELPGFWILDAEALPVEKEDGRWLHRTRVRLRARELGQFVWPAQPVEIEAPDGATLHLVLDGRPLEVVSVQPDFQGRGLPFGLREASGAPAAPGSAWGAAAAGALAGGASVALIGIARRARRRQHVRVSDRDRDAGRQAVSPWRSAGLALDEVGARLDVDPLAAKDALSRALRTYVSDRWRRDVCALTTPELAALTPPPGSARDWPELLELLRGLDEARFAPGAAGGEGARSALDRVRAFVVTTTPPGARD